MIHSNQQYEFALSKKRKYYERKNRRREPRSTPAPAPAPTPAPEELPTSPVDDNHSTAKTYTGPKGSASVHYITATGPVDPYTGNSQVFGSSPFSLRNTTIAPAPDPEIIDLSRSSSFSNIIVATASNEESKMAAGPWGITNIGATTVPNYYSGGAAAATLLLKTKVTPHPASVPVSGSTPTHNPIHNSKTLPPPPASATTTQLLAGKLSAKTGKASLSPISSFKSNNPAPLLPCQPATTAPALPCQPNTAAQLLPCQLIPSDPSTVVPAQPPVHHLTSLPDDPAVPVGVRERDVYSLQWPGLEDLPVFVLDAVTGEVSNGRLRRRI